jgi:beta-ureidopropionase / N-carbamoyl-L-amino-acid hydrolase
VDKNSSARAAAEQAADGSGFDALWSSLHGIGRDAGSGGYRRFVWGEADLACRDWFEAQAADRGLRVETDRNGNQWATWEPDHDHDHIGNEPSEPAADPNTPDSTTTTSAQTTTPGALAIGSHLDSVPDGGAFDGPLGVISSLAAIDLLRSRGWRPARRIVVANFADEEGARFGVACAGSRLMTGQLAPDRARALRDADGTRLADAMERAGRDPGLLGRDEDRLAGIAQFVELHIEQGRRLVDEDAAVGVAAAIWPHGRWCFDFTGEANHAGTTALSERRDPMLTYAHTVLSARKKAAQAGALATFGRLQVDPNGTNAIPSRVRAWLDGRAPDEAMLRAVLEQITTAASERALRDGTSVNVTNESFTGRVDFDETLRNRLHRVLGGAPILPTGAGHDAGILAAEVPTAMLFVRNPTGLSHSPGEHAETVDCLSGVVALTDVIADLAGGERGPV